MKKPTYLHLKENPSNHVFARNAEAPDLCMIQKPLKSYVWTAA